MLVGERVIALRAQLTADGLDAGPVTIAWHLEREGLRAPSTSTIRRILHQAGSITPEPRKRPRSSYTRFQASQPNEMWQSDFTHSRLLGGGDVEILNWLDDHSRYLLSCTVHQPVSGDQVVAVFLAAVDQHGSPASTLTDNGSVYTSRFTGGRNAFEYLLPVLGIRQKNGSPGHPQTQGKIERFHRLSSAGSLPGRQRAAPRSFSSSSTRSARITTSSAPTARWTAAHQARHTGPHQRPPRPTGVLAPTTGSDTTGSTPRAR